MTATELAQARKVAARILVPPEAAWAAEEWVRRQKRESHPVGAFDKKSRWYPSEAERQECCDRVRRPSASWPYSLMKHCRSRDHVLGLFGVSRDDFNRALRAQNGGRL